MRPDDKVELTNEDLLEIEASILSGVVSRASILSFMFAPAFFIYSFTSHQILTQFKPNLTIWENTWPRFLFNALPLLLMGWYFRDFKKNTRQKALIWVIGLPMIFAAACMIHVWPMMWEGQVQVYPYVHAANIFIMVLALLVAAPPPKYMITQALVFGLVFMTPICFLMIRADNMILLNFALGDIMIGMTATAFATHTIYRLRLKIATLDRKIRRMASPFLGNSLAEAIYNQRSEYLENRKAHAMIMLMDIRGYTDFYKSAEPDVAREFMTEYHGLVSRYLGQFGGHWHKSIGDAQLASFGAMDAEADLSDIPGLESDLKAAEFRREQQRFENVLRASFVIAFQFERLKQKFDIQESLSLGIAVSQGEIEIRVQGDQKYKKELDIDGKVIIRCARLEAYTKVIRNNLAPNSSLLILSPEMSVYAEKDRTFKTWEIDSPEKAVPNFPEIKSVLYHVFRDSDERRERILTLRAS